MIYKLAAITTPTSMVGVIFLSGLFDLITSGANLENICGHVPIFERKFGLSINKSLKNSTGKNYSSDDVGDFRILHGLNAIPGEWPWIARLNMCDGPSCQYCTGSLMSSKWILSAGHCGAVARNKALITKLTASIGLYDLVAPDKTAREVKIDRVIMHPDFSHDPLVNDLALFHIDDKLEFDDYIQPVCLISEVTKNLIPYAERRNCFVVGYGLTERENFAIKLQKLSIGVREPGACNGDTLNSIPLTRNTLCIGPKNERNIGSSCKGDSGGPNICYEPETNKWRLFGSVSYGPDICDREAGDKWLSVATDLASYRSWILETIEADS